MYLHARGQGELRDEQADRARAEDQKPVSRREAGGLERPQRVAAWLDQGASDRVHRVRQRVQRRDRNGQLLRERAWPATADADLVSVLAYVRPASQAPVAPAAAEHRVASDAAPGPARVDARAECGYGAAPLMADPDRKPGVALVQIRHLTGEELGIGAADPGALDVHHDITRSGRRRCDIHDRALARSGNHERPHALPGIRQTPSPCMSDPPDEASVRLAENKPEIDRSAIAVNRRGGRCAGQAPVLPGPMRLW